MGGHPRRRARDLRGGVRPALRTSVPYDGRSGTLPGYGAVEYGWFAAHRPGAGRTVRPRDSRAGRVAPAERFGARGACPRRRRVAVAADDRVAARGGRADL